MAPIPVAPAAPSDAPAQAKFLHQNGTQLRMQTFVLVEDAQGRLVLQRIEGFDGFCLAGENMLLNESPDEAAQRVAKTWYASPLDPKLDRILSFPATGGEDVKWYLVFVYRARMPADLQLTPDTVEWTTLPLDEEPAEWAMAHDDIWHALRKA